MTTTPRDAIGLSERLHAAFIRSGRYLFEEAATQLEALHKELAQTQAHLAIRNGDLAEAVRERDSHQERVKELEQISHIQARTYRGMKARALCAEQERDEALERAAKVAENPPQPLGRGHACIATGRLIAAAIRRLAAGPDKEKTPQPSRSVQQPAEE